MNSRQLVEEYIWKNKAHLRQRQAWRFFARAVLLFAGIYAVSIALVLAVLAVAQ